MVNSDFISFMSTELSESSLYGISRKNRLMHLQFLSSIDSNKESCQQPSRSSSPEHQNSYCAQMLRIEKGNEMCEMQLEPRAIA